MLWFFSPQKLEFNKFVLLSISVTLTCGWKSTGSSPRHSNCTIVLKRSLSSALIWIVIFRGVGWGWGAPKFSLMCKHIFINNLYLATALTKRCVACPYIIRHHSICQNIWGVQKKSPSFPLFFSFSFNLNDVMIRCQTRLYQPIEFSLEQSLHFCTMLALPLPPFNGALSWRTKKAMNTRNAHEGLMNFGPLTTKVTYCHLSEISPQFPHLSWAKHKNIIKT